MARPQKLKPDEVLDRASEIFWKQGADAVSTRDLEAALGLRAPAIYRRFENKGALLAASIDHYVGKVVEPRVARLLDAAEDPLAALRRFFDAMLEPHGSEPELRGCLLTNTAGLKDAEPAREALDRGFGVIQAGFARQITRAKDMGRLAPETDADALARALFISLQGLLVLARGGATDLHAGVDATFELLPIVKSG
ncbi:TetR/AcrR family transcriptional regulator [Mameliella sediminis]|uniref:TetR/AcrR family transcriptional regulator n=1 Tax=Mameliella sediminis TaxID=2836866 RepID=UPI001C4473F9|nr:TetR/AcrR family transcriptional regulator [Mameliella sediminis]MBY6113933.1 TetR/AcrR family transcriptional regulator [Antarctobacter heliothermus]MBY6142719.1 TetR/AcrR family transcriptional regulator [Mameliella alba]MBV7395230.1 TetR/AcrR family transcriptional regulator [Mameliella sediminis]MBY6159574.1 TetR/AcrR family transcriptional regulator [Mameliella alba]MBY6168045.1 TetR/AcrR family transcriptional regulator [Mameliella alba]